MNRSPLAAGLALALASLLLPAATQARPAAPASSATDRTAAGTLDAILVTATRSPQPIATGLAATTVLDRAAIEAAQAPDLIDLLARQPGIDVSRTGGPGAVSTLFLRGGNSNHVLVLVDGVRVNSAQQGLHDFAHLPLDRIERIEIVRGPRAALWGSDAIGGVIQIFTRDPGERTAQLRFGRFERREASVQWGGGDGRGSFGVGAGVQDVGGFNASTPRNFSFDPDRDGYRNRHFSLAGRTTLGTQAVAAQALVADAEVDFDRGRSFVESHSASATLSGPLGEGWDHQLLLGNAAEDLLTRSAFGSRFESRRDSLDWLHELALGPGQALLFGLNHVREDALARNAAGGTVYDRGRRNTGLFGAWRGSQGAQQWDLAARLDDNSQFGRTSTAQAAWGLAFADGWRLRTSWGQGFRAPSTNELYSPGFGGFFAGNPALRPERSQSLEAGLEWQDGTRFAGLSAYRSRVADLIAFAGPRFAAGNVQRARLDGIELEGGFAWGTSRWRGHLGWQRAENAATGAALLRRAPRKAALSVDLPAGERLRLGLDAQAVARRQDFDGALPGYARLDLRLDTRPAPGWRLGLRIENLLDRDYTLASGFATPPRTALLELAYRAP
jgi:vitamin B12 transporter